MLNWVKRNNTSHILPYLKGYDENLHDLTPLVHDSYVMCINLKDKLVKMVD